MPLLGRLLKNRHAGDEGLAWNAPHLAGADSLVLRSDAFDDGGTIPAVHASKRAGGANVSPSLTWSQAPATAVQLLLVVEDPDAPTNLPFVHCVALVDPSLTRLPEGGLAADQPAAGVRPLRAGTGAGYLGPAPVRGHGPHRYVFQLFALGQPVRIGPGDGALASASPRDVIAAAGNVVARGRLEGRYERA